MNICMVVCNNVSRDNRVLREASTLQAAGHSVFIIGILKESSDAPFELLSDGVKIYRVAWRGIGYLRLALKSLLWMGALFFIAATLGYWLSLSIWIVAGYLLFFLGVSAAIAMVAWFTARQFPLSKRLLRETRDRERQHILRNTEQLFASGKLPPTYPQPSSLIPKWVKGWLLDLLATPVAFLGPRFAQFALSIERSRVLARFAIRLSPDVIHAHDCTALPIASQVKSALSIPVVYDAHEVYEAVAARRFGVTDYFIMLHRRYLKIVDYFITVNKSIALYYRMTYPYLPEAVVIRNASTPFPSGQYDGRLHSAAGVSASSKILIYQGGFTKGRGLDQLVRSAHRFPDDWVLVMMGWGPLEKELRRIANEQVRDPAPGRIRFLAPVPARDVLAWTAGATLGVIPYEDTSLNHWFCTPNKLWEYAGAGVPMLVQPFPELMRVVEEYSCGWVMPAEAAFEQLPMILSQLSLETLEHAKVGCARFMKDDSWPAAYADILRGVYFNIALRLSRS